MKKAEKKHLEALRNMGCIVCLREGFGQSRPEDTAIHHIRTGQGMGQRASNYDTIGLCPMHHQHGGYGVAIHAGQREWENKHGTEKELLQDVKRRLGNNTDRKTA